MRISVVGCGYLGAVHAACMATLGHTVIGVDVDETKVASLNEGVPPFHEPDFEPLLSRVIADGSLRFTTDYADVADADIHFIAVGTPQIARRYAADMQYVDAAVDSIIAAVGDTSTRPVVIAGKSTVPVGTAQEITEKAKASGKDIIVVWNPEFLREGFAVEDTLHPDRIVYGVPDDEREASVGIDVLDECYAALLTAGVPRLIMNQPTAELVKVAANSFLATKISFINAMAQLCDATGADVTELAAAIGYDDRIGSKFLRAGVGFGGGCLPKDIRAFMARAGELGVDETLTFLREVDAINRRQRSNTVHMAADLLGGRVAGHKIAVLGAAFKPNSDDLRDSPALDIAQRLWAQGADVWITDPQALEKLAEKRPNLNLASTIEEACAGAHLVMLLTEWDEYRSLDPGWLRTIIAEPVIIDGRNVLDPQQWIDAGWQYHGIGRFNHHG